jgi:hypothetical protein
MAVRRGDLYLTALDVHQPKLTGAVFEAQAAPVEHFCGGVGRRENFDNEMRRTIEVLVAWNPVPRRESSIRIYGAIFSGLIGG